MNTSPGGRTIESLHWLLSGLYQNKEFDKKNTEKLYF